MSTDRRITHVDRRIHDKLRAMVDRACEEVMPDVAVRIKHAVRRAYYLGCEDGMQLQRDKEEQDNGK